MRALWIASMLPTSFNWLAGPWNIRSLLALRDYEGLEVRAVCPVGLTPPGKYFTRVPPDIAEARKWLEQRRAAAAAGEIEGVPVTYPRWAWLPKKLFWGYEGRLMYYELRRHLAGVIRSYKPDVIHAPWLNPESVCAALCGLEHKIPSVAQGVGNDANYYPGAFPGRQRVAKDLRLASTLLFNCDSTRRMAASYGIEHPDTRIIYHGVDIDRFCPPTRREERPERTIITVAQLIPRKNHQLLLRAYTRLPEAVRNTVRLEFVGGGASRPELECLVRQLGLTERVRFVGQPSHADLVRHLQEAHLFCLSSLSEGLPVASIEAMACGLPVIASNVDGIHEAVVEGVSGLLFPSDDVEALASTLQRALSLDWDREAVRRVVLDRFTWRLYAANVHALYRELCARRAT